MSRKPIAILLLEDNPADAQLVQRELTRAGLRVCVTHTSNARAFHDALTGGTFDVILADYNIPGFSGMAALELAVELAPETPFVFVSGSLGEELAIEALRNGATDYIIKDRLSRLPSAVSRALHERTMRERLQLAVAATRDVIFDHVLGDDVWASDALRTQWGHRIENSRTTLAWWREHIHPDDRDHFDREVGTALAYGTRRFELTYRFRRANGAYGHAYVQALVMRDADGTATRIVGALQDETSRIEAERQLEREQRVSSLGRLAAVIAHEFNNVLMVMQPSAELIKRRAADDAVSVRSADRIIAAVQRGRQITQDILRAANPGRPSRREFDLAAWLHELTPELHGILPAHVRLVVDAATDGVIIDADPAQLQQVVVNLAVNARDAMIDGGDLRIALQANAGAAELRVCDSGCGIAPEVLAQIFEPLFTTKSHGTGLGLAVVRQLVTANGGTIDVRSELGRGTEFTLRFPARSVMTVS